MKVNLLVLGLFALFGVFLIRGGLTGMVVAESCCFPPGCSAENICTASATIERPAYMTSEDSNALTVVRLLIIVISTSLTLAYLRKQPPQPEQQLEQ